MKIDLHCHSRFSQRPTLWIMQKLGCPESLTDPLAVYELAQRRGMNAVTITDHNMISGVQEIAHLPNTFVSCEYTTYFPEDRCKVHVLVYDISESQHEQLLEARQNILEFVELLDHLHIAHACAHPLFGPNDRLKAMHIEKLLLLFKVWEWNGDLASEMNLAVQQLIGSLTEERIDLLREQHGIEPVGVEPWRKCLIGGSDDHSSLQLAHTHTEVRGAVDFASFWNGVQQMQSRIHARTNTPEALARNVYSIGYQFYRNKFQLQRYIRHDTFLLFLERILQTSALEPETRLMRLQRFLSGQRRTTLASETLSLFDLARHEAVKIIQESADFSSIVAKGLTQGRNVDQLWSDFVNTLSNKLMVHLGEHLAERLANARLFDLFHSLGSAAALYAVLAPYFVSYSHFIGQRKQARQLLEALEAPIEHATPREARVAHFTDTFFEVNGVARTLQQQLNTARQLGKHYSVITCDSIAHPYEEGLHLFQPVGSWTLPEYPEVRLFAPPFLQLLKHCYEEGITHIHTSTPGPMGLAALGIARILQLPISGTYHTAMPEYGRILTEDSYVEEVLWKGMIVFYEQLDVVYSPSRATAQGLIDRGLNPDKLQVYPRGVNTERFHPDKGNDAVRTDWALDKDRILLLYVGRISKEKALEVLTDAFLGCLEQGLAVQLLVVGDGPYRPEMETRLAGTPTRFTGYIDGEQLPALYASSDIFVFPSATDTFGNVVLEAQAAGVPVIVSNQGGPQENMEPEETGLMFAAGNTQQLMDAIKILTLNPEKRHAFGAAARKHMEQRSFVNAFETLYEMYTAETHPHPSSPLPFPIPFSTPRTVATGTA